MSERADFVEIIEVRERGWWVIMGICLLGIAIGAWMFTLGAGIYLVAAVLVVACAAFGHNAWLSRPGCSFLAISPEGLTVKFGGGSSFFKWTEIERFGVAEIFARRRLHRGVGIRFMNPKKSLHLNREGVCPQKRIRTDGFDAVLFSSYGRGCAELADYLNEQRERWIEQV